MGWYVIKEGQLWVSRRLAGSWKALYKCVLSYQQGALSELNSQHARQLLYLIQQSLQSINASVPHEAALPINKGEPGGFFY